MTYSTGKKKNVLIFKNWLERDSDYISNLLTIYKFINWVHPLVQKIEPKKGLTI
jgi:hypothetical protein